MELSFWCPYGKRQSMYTATHTRQNPRVSTRERCTRYSWILSQARRPLRMNVRPTVDSVVVLLRRSCSPALPTSSGYTTAQKTDYPSLHTIRTQQQQSLTLKCEKMSERISASVSTSTDGPSVHAAANSSTYQARDKNNYAKSH